MYVSESELKGNLGKQHNQGIWEKRKGKHNKTQGRTNIRKQQKLIEIYVKLSENYKKTMAKLMIKMFFVHVLTARQIHVAILADLCNRMRLFAEWATAAKWTFSSPNGRCCRQVKYVGPPNGRCKPPNGRRSPPNEPRSRQMSYSVFGGGPAKWTLFGFFFCRLSSGLGGTAIIAYSASPVICSPPKVETVSLALPKNERRRDSLRGSTARRLWHCFKTIGNHTFVFFWRLIWFSACNGCAKHSTVCEI